MLASNMRSPPLPFRSYSVTALLCQTLAKLPINSTSTTIQINITKIPESNPPNDHAHAVPHVFPNPAVAHFGSPPTTATETKRNIPPASPLTKQSDHTAPDPDPVVRDDLLSALHFLIVMTQRALFCVIFVAISPRRHAAALDAWIMQVYMVTLMSVKACDV